MKGRTWRQKQQPQNVLLRWGQRVSTECLGDKVSLRENWMCHCSSYSRLDYKLFTVVYEPCRIKKKKKNPESKPTYSEYNLATSSAIFGVIILFCIKKTNKQTTTLNFITVEQFCISIIQNNEPFHIVKRQCFFCLFVLSEAVIGNRKAPSKFINLSLGSYPFSQTKFPLLF